MMTSLKAGLYSIANFRFKGLILIYNASNMQFLWQQDINNFMEIYH